VSEQGFSNELARALARSDVEQLKAVLALYHDWSDRVGKPGHPDHDVFPDELNVWFNADQDFDQGLALVILAAATYDEPKFLAGVAAGLLEDLVTPDRPLADEYRERIVDEARRTARFRWMLSGVWTNSADIYTKRAIVEAVGNVDCNRHPLPERPWA